MNLELLRAEIGVPGSFPADPAPGLSKSDQQLDLDCLIVLGARLNQEGRPGRIARMRVEHALRLWQAAGGACRLMITGGCSREDLTVSEALAVDFAQAMNRPAKTGRKKDEPAWKTATRKERRKRRS